MKLKLTQMTAKSVAAMPLSAVAAIAVLISQQAHASDIYYVGYQYGSGLPLPKSSASWHHGEVWFNYLVPNALDRALFNVTFDPQGNGMPANVYFGDFTVSADPPWIPAPYVVPGGDAFVKRLDIQEGTFQFHLTDSNGVPQGSLTVDETVVVGYAPPNALSDIVASLTVKGGALRQTSELPWYGLSIGEGLKAIGTLSVDGSQTTVEVVRDLGLGHGGGTGYLNVSGGASVSSRHILNGWASGPSGQLPVAHIEVRDSGSLLSSLVGVNQGTIMILNGGSAATPSAEGNPGFAYVAPGQGAVGTALIRDQDSSWSYVDRFTVGGVYHSNNNASGELRIENGGNVECKEFFVGDGSLASGLVSVTGLGSRLEVINTGVFGDEGQCAAEVSDQGVIQTGNALLAVEATSTSIVDVHGFGAKLNCSTLTVGHYGEGTLKVRNNGQVACTGGFIGRFANADGLVSITGGNATLVADGTLNIAGSALPVPGGTGKVAASDGGRLWIKSKLNLYSAATVSVINGGRALLGSGDISQVAANTLSIGSAGSLFGTGVVEGKLANEAGEISPGLPIGTLHVVGPISLASSAKLSVQVGGLGQDQYDKLQATGVVTLGGVLDVSLTNGYVPAPGDSVIVVSWPFSSQFDSVVPPPGHSVAVDYKAGTGVVVTFDVACPPDCDASGGLNIDDFICFQTLFALQDPGADCDNSGLLNIDDFICFQTLFAIGC